MRLLIGLAAIVAAAITPSAAAQSNQHASRSCLDGGDRTTKLTLIQRLRHSPGILVLGSSRAREAEPRFVTRLTGHTAFNAAVEGGDAPDAWAMVRFAADRFPGRPRRYIWFVDVVLGHDRVRPDLAADPRARAYVTAPAGSPPQACPLNNRYLPDGMIAHHPPFSKARRARNLARSVRRLLASLRSRPVPPARPQRSTYFEQTLGFMNQQGARPVIVLNPIYPRILAALRARGFPARQAADAYLAQLRRSFDFVLVDCEDIRTWGGRASDFVDATHVDERNMRRMLRYVVRHSDGALR